MSGEHSCGSFRLGSVFEYRGIPAVPCDRRTIELRTHLRIGDAAFRKGFIQERSWSNARETSLDHNYFEAVLANRCRDDRVLIRSELYLGKTSRICNLDLVQRRKLNHTITISRRESQVLPIRQRGNANRGLIEP